MPKPIHVKLDRSGIAALLKSEGFAMAVKERAERIAEEVKASIGEDVDVAVDEYVTDRAAASITIRDARGRLWEVRDGVLTRAAATQGLEVTRRE